MVFQQLNVLTEANNFLPLFMSPYHQEDSYSTLKARQTIDDCVKALKTETATKADLKKVKFVYDYVHRSFLKVYKLENSFADIFSKGEYNCLSASALYAIIFSKLDIPYKIIEAPQHVYLVAYPQTHKILIETTSPEKGYFQFNDNFINQYIKSLYNSKLISKQEYDTSSVSNLFNRYYFSSSGVSLKELAGMQFSNYAIYDIGVKKYDEAISEIQKAWYLNPGERTKYLLKSSVMYFLEKTSYDKKNDIDKLILLCRLNNLKDKEVENEMIKREFWRLTENQLISNSNYLLYEDSYSQLVREIADSALQKDISFNYHSELARLGYLNSKDSTYELTHLRAAYQINAKNANLQSIILSYLDRLVGNNNDARVILKVMTAYEKDFDFIKDNNGFNGVKANCLLQLSYQYFATNDLVKGETHLKEFELLINAHKQASYSETYVEKAYAFAAGVYYKKGNYARCKQLIKAGLIYAPDNFGLKQRLNQL